MTKATLLLTIVSAGLTVSCSPAVSVRPLDEKGSCITEPHVEGEWISPADSPSQSESTARWKVTARSGRYDVEMLTIPEDGSAEPTVTHYDVCLVSREGALFFDAEFGQRVQGNRTTGREDLALGIVPVHVIGRLRAEPDFLVLEFLDSDWVRENTSPSFREVLTFRSPDMAIITAASPEVLKFLTVHADDPNAFALRMHLCRPDADCVAKAYEDALIHTPTDVDEKDLLEMLGALSEHYLQTGHYRQALPSLRRAAALKPEDASARNRPATALLLDRDYDAARREFSSIQAVHPDDAGAQEGIAWSYFLEGRFEEAGRALRPLVDSAERDSIEPVLLAYVALKRSGQDSEAKRLLDKESARFFRGAVDEQLLLLLFMERIDTYPYEVSKNAKDESKARFFSAELCLAQGQADGARRDLWTSVTLGRKDSIYAAAAKIELERMSSGYFGPHVTGAPGRVRAPLAGTRQ